jgi:hypothetical protein
LKYLVVPTNQNSSKQGFLRKAIFAAYKMLSHTFEIILFIEHGYTTAFTQIVATFLCFCLMIFSDETYFDLDVGVICFPNGGEILQQDKALCHQSRSTMAFLEEHNISTMP